MPKDLLSTANDDIIARLSEIDAKMEQILDMPDELQTEDVWESYYELEREASALEDKLEG
jgi:hypothetical protein